jgi:CheY-like chemotaxis protein
MKILAVMTDLFFMIQINDAAKKLGLSVEMVQDGSRAIDKIREAKPALIIFDLNCAAADPIGTIQQIASDPEMSGIPTVGFVSHVQTALKLKAEQSGCGLVLARSAFAQNLPEILRRVAAGEPNG